jgi:formiminotetrahydrofolate cyclodeaminase
MSSSEQVLAERSLHELLESVAEQTPAPGGGSTAAVVGALAAGLVEMAAKFTIGRDEYAALRGRMEEVRDSACELRELLVALGERELEAYAPVLDALRLDAADPDRDARAARSVAELGAEVASGGNAHVAGDAITGVLLAEAACRAAGRLAEINLARASSDPRLEEVAALARQASAARTKALDGKS